MSWTDEEQVAGLEAAIAQLQRDLPGWWWSVGNCHVSADATVGPDRKGPDKHLLRLKTFDRGIESNLAHPATVTEALLSAITEAKRLKAAFTSTQERDAS